MQKTILVASLAVLFSAAASASEDFTLRYAPGIGGADMSAPLEGGWVVQSPVYVYRGHIDETSTTVTQLQPLGAPIPSTATTTINSRISVGVNAVLPRLLYMSQKQFLGATVGFTAMLPLVQQRAAVSLRGVSTTVNPAGVGLEPFGVAVNGIATTNAGAIAAANSNTSTGVGDLEIAPVLRWAGEGSQWLFVPAVILPTGQFQADKAANPGAGDFYTFRPLVQYSLIGDGWDMGARASFALNGTNGKTHYRTGNYLNVDVALMKSLSDSTRLGLVGYAVAQTTADHLKSAPTGTDPLAVAAASTRLGLTDGRKGTVYGLGPEFAYIKGGGEWEIDGRILKEFGASDRPEGTALWLNLSMPF